MRQHITPAQLQALTDEQRERLREWWELKDGDFVFLPNNKKKHIGTLKIYSGNKRLILNKGIVHYYEQFWVRKCLPLLSIGQCIQLLGAKLLHINHYHKQWQVSFLREQKEEELFITELYADDLIDALWQAVKEVL